LNIRACSKKASWKDITNTRKIVKFEILISMLPKEAKENTFTEYAGA
jgi:hypothetical protein